MENTTNLDIDNYSIDELKEIFGLEDNFNVDDINNSLIQLLKKYSALGEKKYMMFLKNAREKLVVFLENKDNHSEVDESEIEEATDEVVNSTTLNTKKYLQDYDITNQLINRKNNINTNDENKHFIYTRNREPILQSHNVPIVQGQINPTLRNINKSIVNLDTQFRQNLTLDTNNTTFDLSEPLIDVTAIRVMSLEIKHCWYTFDQAYGTTDFYVDNSFIQIPNGNYSNTEIMTIVNNELSNNGISDLIFSYQTNTGKTLITNDNSSNNYTIQFYDNENPGLKKKNNNLGWILGFKTFDVSNNLQFIIDASSSMTSSGLVDTLGPRYILLEIDDFNNNHYNRNYISIDDTHNNLKYPPYYTSDISLNDPTKRFTRDANGNVVWVDSGLKQSQVFTISQIFESRQAKNQSLHQKTTMRTNDIISKLPIQYTNPFGTLIIGYNFINKFERLYYGPVRIQRMRVAIYNECGQLLNLNHQDFSITLQTDELYQY